MPHVFTAAVAEVTFTVTGAPAGRYTVEVTGPGVKTLRPGEGAYTMHLDAAPDRTFTAPDLDLESAVLTRWLLMLRRRPPPLGPPCDRHRPNTAQPEKEGTAMTHGYATIDDMKKANHALGHSWFDRATTDYHGSKIETGVIGDFYFVESSHKVLGESDSGRVFRPVAVGPDGAATYLRGGESFDTLDAAVAVINAIVDSR